MNEQLLRKREIYRQLQNKGFAMPLIQTSEFVISDEENYNSFNDSLLVCENCPLHSDKVLGSGPITSPVMIVSDYPRDDDIYSGVPLSGTPGHFLTIALQGLKIDRRCIYMTHAVKCRCFCTPGPDELATCYPYIKYEIERMKPKYIITLGSAALKAVVNNFELKVSEYRGSIIAMGDKLVYPTWHPDYLLKLNGVEYKKASNEFIFDLNNAFEDAKKAYPTYRWNLEE